MPLTSLPNLLTLSRILAIPVVVATFYMPGDYARWFACALFAAAGFTDWLDGHMARRWEQQSEIGRFLDPIADKLLVAATLLMLVAHAARRRPGALLAGAGHPVPRDPGLGPARVPRRAAGRRAGRRGSPSGRPAIQMVAIGVLLDRRCRARASCRVSFDRRSAAVDRRAADARHRLRISARRPVAHAPSRAPPAAQAQACSSAVPPECRPLSCGMRRPSDADFRSRRLERQRQDDVDDATAAGTAWRAASSVSTVKHAHHEFDIDQPGKDSLAPSRGRRHRGDGRLRAALGADARAARRAGTGARGVGGADERRSTCCWSKASSAHAASQARGASAGRRQAAAHPDDPHIVAVASDRPVAGLAVPVLRARRCRRRSPMFILAHLRLGRG